MTYIVLKVPLNSNQPDKENLAASQTVTTAQIAPKICQGQPPTMCLQCSRFYPNQFTFGRVIAEANKHRRCGSSTRSWCIFEGRRQPGMIVRK